ncbi:MAG: hypothetical protein HON62_04385 [Rhodospirillaceae bacterium]|jgi:hypothetical protein|nr:hypothetical protein [Rhodospirillaceae bacterium]
MLAAKLSNVHYPGKPNAASPCRALFNPIAMILPHILPLILIDRRSLSGYRRMGFRDHFGNVS